jgi:hypothetical protein
MTILDKLLQADPPATALTATAASTNTLDMQQARDMNIAGNIGMDMHWEVYVSLALTSGGSTTLQIQSQGSSDNTNWFTMAETDAIPKANLTTGTRIVVPLGQQQPQQVGTGGGIPRYYRLNYVIATGPFTGGTIEADLVVSAPHMNNPPSYPPGITVAN